MKLKVCSMPKPPSPQFLQCRQSQKNLISFIAPSHVEQNGHCTPHDLLFVLYLVFLEGQVFFFRCSHTSGPWNRMCIIGYTFELLLFLF